MDELTVTDNVELVPRNSGWEIERDCPIIMKSTRKHELEEYRMQFERLQTIEGAVQFWQGDVANAGKEEHGYGAMTEIAEENGISAKTMWDFAYVARQTTSARAEVYPQQPTLSFRHYKVVAPLEEDEQVDWLSQAGEQSWSAAELRKQIKGNEWEPRYFNHWSAMPIESWQQEYPGQIPAGILKNVLHYTTHQGDIVIDAFGGGGNMALTCERMKRGCITYDIDPQFPGIIRHNALEPFPDDGVQLVFLDPPYWGQKQGEYASDPDDLSNVEDLGRFHLLLKRICDNAKNALAQDGYLVLIIGASQTKDYYIDHAAEMYALLKDEWQHVNSVAAAYPTTQYTGNDVNNAKKHGYMLNLYTTIQFWQKI